MNVGSLPRKRAGPYLAIHARKLGCFLPVELNQAHYLKKGLLRDDAGASFGCPLQCARPVAGDDGPRGAVSASQQGTRLVPSEPFILR